MPPPRPAPPHRHIAITGASGLLGSLLVPWLEAAGHRVTRLVRRRPGPGEVAWDPAAGTLDPAALRGVDAVIHLAGENIAAHRWTPERKAALLASRVEGTRLLAGTLARLPDGPRTLLSASAIGYYGDRGEEVLTEASPPGRGFLPELATAWEAATEPAAAAGVRVVRVRLGLVLTPRGGLLHRMLLPFKLGIGGQLSSGAQWMSWISAVDVTEIFGFLLEEPSLTGPVNAVGPAPARNRDLTRAVAAAVHRPALLPVPAFGLRLLFGEMADQAILASTRVAPAVLEAAGYRFRHPELSMALAALLGREAAIP